VAEQKPEVKTPEKTPPKSYTVILSYDLKSPPGLHKEFIDAMIAKQWKFEYSGKKLPQTTCYATFKDGVTKENAISTAHSDVDKVEEDLKEINKAFSVERRYAVAFPVSDSKVDFKSTTKD